MSESHKFNGSLDEAKEVFPDLPWKAARSGKTWVFDEKQGEYVVVTDGDYIVKIGNRYEVSDKKPREAKAATAKSEGKTEAKKSAKESKVPEAKEVEPQPDPEEGEAEVASTPNGATSF